MEVSILHRDPQEDAQEANPQIQTNHPQQKVVQKGHAQRTPEQVGVNWIIKNLKKLDFTQEIKLCSRNVPFSRLIYLDLE